MSEDKMLVNDKDVVFPGEVLSEGMSFLPGNGTYRFGDKIMANRLGLLMVDGKVLKTVPLAGRYLPKRNDVIIGRVFDILMSGWRLDIASPYSAVLPLKDATFNYIEKGEDLTRYFELDDYLVAKISNVTSQNLVDVSCKGPGLQKLKGGRIIKVNTHKVPRIIGKKGSMVSMIKKATGCRIIVGQNGLVWISGEPEAEVIAVSTINLIETKAHICGLTNMIKEHLEKITGKTIELEIPEEGSDSMDDNQFSDECESSSSSSSEGREFSERRGNNERREYSQDRERPRYNSSGYNSNRGGSYGGNGGGRRFPSRPYQGPRKDGEYNNNNSGSEGKEQMNNSESYQEKQDKSNQSGSTESFSDKNNE
jgi:exosome complex component RRP4